MKTIDLITGLPGESLVREGLADLQSGKRTAGAYLAAIARPRLVRAGLLPETGISLPAEPELELYRLLRREGGDAYSRYNALLRELISFEQALDHRFRRQH
jgi:hypothetical protein